MASRPGRPAGGLGRPADRPATVPAGRAGRPRHFFPFPGFPHRSGHPTFLVVGHAGWLCGRRHGCVTCSLRALLNQTLRQHPEPAAARQPTSWTCPLVPLFVRILACMHGLQTGDGINFANLQQARSASGGLKRPHRHAPHCQSGRSTPHPRFQCCCKNLAGRFAKFIPFKPPLPERHFDGAEPPNVETRGSRGQVMRRAELHRHLVRFAKFIPSTVPRHSADRRQLGRCEVLCPSNSMCGRRRAREAGWATTGMDHAKTSSARVKLQMCVCVSE